MKIEITLEGKELSVAFTPELLDYDSAVTAKQLLVKAYHAIQPVQDAFLLAEGGHKHD